MATSREYAYFLKGNKVAIVERDITAAFDNDLSSRDYGPDVQYSSWKSPKASVADGIELEYSYSPKYFIDETEDVNTAIDTYVSTGGLLKIIDQGDNNYATSPESLSDGSFIVLRKAGRWNGLHKVKDVSVAGSIVLYTKFSGSATVQKAFEEAPDLYYNVSALEDESDDVPVSDYLAKAVVYYVKSKVAEDMMQIEEKEYFMKEFRSMIEKHNDSRKWGSSRVMPDWSSAIL